MAAHEGPRGVLGVPIPRCSSPTPWASSSRASEAIRDDDSGYGGSPRRTRHYSPSPARAEWRGDQVGPPMPSTPLRRPKSCLGLIHNLNSGEISTPSASVKPCAYTHPRRPRPEQSLDKNMECPTNVAPSGTPLIAPSAELPSCPVISSSYAPARSSVYDAQLAMVDDIR
jgi:hypothetical protein